MSTYFADTSFWIAISSKRDQFHSQAVFWQAIVAQPGSKIVTTEAVLWEWLNAFADTTTRGIAAEGYGRAHADSRIDVVPFSSELNRAAVDLYRSRGDKGWSLTDCLSVLVMEQRQLTQALTTDRHFEQAGMKALLLYPPES